MVRVIGVVSSAIVIASQNFILPKASLELSHNFKSCFLDDLARKHFPVFIT